MAYEPTRKDTLFIPSGPKGDHLYVITTDACGKGMHVLACLCSIKEGQFYDETCLVTVGEHEFVTRDSYIAYNFARVEGGNRIGMLVEKQLWRPDVPASEELTQRILDGYMRSPFTPRFVKAQLRSAGLVE